jgi:glutaredoxin-related protein
MQFMLRLAVCCAVLGRSIALSAAAFFYEKAPCPRRQLLGYVAHVGGGGGQGMQVYARSRTDETAWLLVGSVAAGSPDAADDSIAAAILAVQLQQRLIVEHACRLDKSLIAAKRKSEIELAVERHSRGPRAIVPMVDKAGSVSWKQMLGCGFAGVSAGRGIYRDFESSNGALAYDRAAVRDAIRNTIASSKIALFAWPQCGFATTARALLSDDTYTDVTVDKFSPQHAELALLSGRPTVPCIYVDGELVGGCHEDEQHPGLAKVLAARRDVASSSPPKPTGSRVSSVRMSLEPEPLCDGCHERCVGCAWAWIDDDFLAAGGSVEALRQRDAAARAVLGLVLFASPQQQEKKGGQQQQATEGTALPTPPAAAARSGEIR